MLLVDKSWYWKTRFCHYQCYCLMRVQRYSFISQIPRQIYPKDSYLYYPHLTNSSCQCHTLTTLHQTCQASLSSRYPKIECFLYTDVSTRLPLQMPSPVPKTSSSSSSSYHHSSNLLHHQHCSSHSLTPCNILVSYIAASKAIRSSMVETRDYGPASHTFRNLISTKTSSFIVVCIKSHLLWKWNHCTCRQELSCWRNLKHNIRLELYRVM